jgi:chemotaxis signal transduction protein
MKLIWLSDYVEGASHKGLYGDESISVVVHYHDGQPIGFVVKQIHDIVSVPSEIIMISPPQRGIVGSSIVNEAVVSILNVEEILNLSGLGHFDQSSLIRNSEKINPSIPVDRVI